MSTGRPKQKWKKRWRAVWAALGSALNWIKSSPRLRLAVISTGGAIIAIVSGVYATQLLPKEKFIGWSKLASVGSFWPLIITFLIWLGIQVAFLRRDERIERFADDRYCLAVVRAMRLDAYARQIRNNPSDIVDARVILEELRVKEQ